MEDTSEGLFPGNNYPTQTTGDIDPSFHGEYRGFFPGGSDSKGAWRPLSSKWGGRGTGGHGGADIYAPYAPHPLETPVRAVADGDFWPMYMQENPNKIGNRAGLTFKHSDGRSYSYRYGHLARFEGRARRVKKGQIIGYAGCSGNADTEGECSECGTCKVNSGHVHLVVFDDKDLPQDPLPFHALKVRYGDGELSKEMDCSKWVKGANALKEEFKAAPPDKALSQLSCDTISTWRRKGKERPALKKPFANIEFDRDLLLEATGQFYGLCASRLKKRFAATPVGDEKTFKAFLDMNLEDATAAILGKLPKEGARKDPLVELAERIVAQVEGKDRVKGLEVGADGKPFDGDQVAGWLLRHISVLQQMLWRVCCGAALDCISANAGGKKGASRYERHTLFSNATYAKYQSKVVAECGVGIGGAAWLSAADRGCNALHMMDPAIVPGPEGPPQDSLAISVTFGAGGLMHATIVHVLAPPPADQPQARAIWEYQQRAVAAAGAIIEVHNAASRHEVLLSGGVAAGLEEKAKAARAEVAKAIVKAISSLKECTRFIREDAPGGEEFIGPLLERIAGDNAALFARLAARSGKPEGDAQMAPVMFMLKAVKPESKPE